MIHSNRDSGVQIGRLQQPPHPAIHLHLIEQPTLTPPLQLKVKIKAKRAIIACRRPRPWHIVHNQARLLA
eukprot:3932176-Rhodomonas_salina.1